MDLRVIQATRGHDENVKFFCGLIDDGELSYFKLGEGGFDLSAVRTEEIATGAGEVTCQGILEKLPVGWNTLTITADPLGTAQVVTDDGSGALAGAGGSGTINYKTGAWEVTFNLAVSPGDPIQAEYQYHGTLSAIQTDDFGLGNGTRGPYYKDLASLPVAEGSILITEEGGQSLADDGLGNLVGDGTGTVDYETGELAVLFASPVLTIDRIQATYQFDGAAKAPSAALTDLESESDPNLYTFTKAFEEGAITFAEVGRGRIVCRVFLDLWEGIDDGNGETPFFFEGGLFNTGDEMVAYFTFSKVKKTGSTRIDFDVAPVL